LKKPILVVLEVEVACSSGSGMSFACVAPRRNIRSSRSISSKSSSALRIAIVLTSCSRKLMPSELRFELGADGDAIDWERMML
jgi:hypothetical protein